MNIKSYAVEILTPCFCAGADQSKAEIRASSIRGELRWWFRVLGGTQAQEKEVFGGVGALEGERRSGAARSSSVVIRVGMLKRAPDWQPPRVSPNDPISYVWFFASVSGKPKGMRWTAKGNVPPGTVFPMTVQLRRPLSDACKILFDKAIESFLRFGGIGLRMTRGLGGLRAANLWGGVEAEKEAATRLFAKSGVDVLWIDRPFDSWVSALAHAGALLKNVLRRQENVKKCPHSPLGSSDRPRQTSAVRFRVLRVGDSDWRLLLLEAPHDRVLEPASRRSEPLLLSLRRELMDFIAPEEPRRPPGQRGHR